MPDSFDMLQPAARSLPAQSGLHLALRCTRHVHAAVDRRTPEAFALAIWLGQNAAAFGLDDATLPDEDGLHGRRGVGAPDWRCLGAAIAVASAGLARARNSPASQWLDAIAGKLELDPIETDILSLALHYRLDQRVERLFDMLSEARGGPQFFQRDPVLIGLLLKQPPDAIATRLAGAARLLDSGLMHAALDGNLGVLTRLVALIRAGAPPMADFRDQLLGTTAPPALPWAAFAHLGREGELAAEMLRAGLAAGQRGINLLLYGPPGTGKTSFASSLAETIGARLRPVGETDDADGEPSRHERLSGLRLALRLSGRGDSVLLFDEAEDLFAGHDTSFGRGFAGSRMFIHRLLEQTQVPVIWTANDISLLGPAVLRRMTMCLELKVPNLRVRTRLWRQMGEAEGVLLAEADAARLARLVPAAPAVAATALRATRLVGGGADTARLLVEGVARAIAGGRSVLPEAEASAAYDPALVSADCDLLALADRLCAAGAPQVLSLLLFGPPGTGKSAWVRHLAARMGLPVLHKRASDLLNPYVGGTEQNIAEAFAEAREAQAFLVFDEADSLLMERAGARQNWEVSQVNEMLTWMESHPLPFACTTNLAGRLDSASLRRFLLKLRFTWLGEAQARAAFQRFFGLAAPAGLDGLRCLTPADFALVARRAALEGAAGNPAALLRLLAAESAGRVGGRGPLGFVGSAAA